MAMQIKKEGVAEMIEWLSTFGKTESNGVTRLLYSSEWVAAQKAVKEKMDKLGFSTSYDCVGNVFGRIEGTDPNSKTILTGSHIDTVIDGGKYDGAYGIIASMLAAEHLKRIYGPPKKTIEVVSICEEEGSRFPITFWGSRNITNLYDIEKVADLYDSEGISFLQAMKDAGFDSKEYSPPYRTDIESFIEVHIEQGIVLEKNHHSIGIVSHIVGQRRFNISIFGDSNHAGTTPMPYRKDAIALTADFIHYTTNLAHTFDPHLVATFGKIHAKPNVPNVIAGEVEISLDIRHYDNAVLDEFCSHIFSYINQKADQAEFSLDIHQWMNVKPVAMSKELNEQLEQIVEKKNISYQPIISGAGHDSQVFGQLYPTALLFVPSVNGISHSPKEYTNLKDLETGIEVLTELLYKLAY